MPRAEPPSWTAGGKVVKVDRVEWVTMPDAQTAMNALQSGDIDFIEAPSFDMLPVLKANKELKVETLSKLGSQTLMRMNFLHPPFDNVKVRRAALLALNQKDVLDALVGNPQYYKVCGAVFGCGTPLATDVGSETLIKGNGMAEAKKLLAESGYDGTPVVIMAPSDVGLLKAAADRGRAAAAQGRLQGRRAGHRLADRRHAAAPARSRRRKAAGTCSSPTGPVPTSSIRSPMSRSTAGARTAAGSAGRRTPRWKRCAMPSCARRRRRSRRRSRSRSRRGVYEQVIYIPLGQYLAPSAWRKELTGVLGGPATPMFWNIDKSE